VLNYEQIRMVARDGIEPPTPAFKELLEALRIGKGEVLVQAGERDCGPKP